MPRQVTYTCKICGVQKLQSNRWFVSQGIQAEYHLITWETAVWEGLLNEDRVEYICGHGCGHKLLDEFLGGTLDGQNEPPAARGQ
jgi:hypothetical protein